MSLTAQQHKLLCFIEAALEEGRVCPSYEEMAAHLGIRSRSNVHALIEQLEARGYIVRMPGRARSITLASPLSKFRVYELMAELRNRGLVVKLEVQ